MTDIQIQTSAQTALYWSWHDEDDDTKPFGADPSIGTFSIDVEEDELSDYGTRDVVNREVTNVTGNVSVTATATHWWHIEAWLDEFDDDPTDEGDGTYTWTTSGDEEYKYIDLVIANTRSGEDYVLEKCAVDMSVSMSSPYGGGDNNVELSFDIDVSNPEKVKSQDQATEPDVRFEDADPLYFKNMQVSVPDDVDGEWVLTELEFSVTNNDEGVTQIPVVQDGETTGGVQDVTRSPGARDIEVDRTVLRTADGDEELDRILTDGEPDGTHEEFDLVVGIGNDIVNGDVTSVDDIHHVEFKFEDLFPTDFDWSGFDERGGDIAQDVSDAPTTVAAEYTVGTETRP